MPRTLKDINIEVGARIKEKRLAQKLTREDLARLSGYTANFIQEVERGRSGLSSESIRALSMALKVSADSLLFGDAPEEFFYISQKLKAVPPQKPLFHALFLIGSLYCLIQGQQSLAMQILGWLRDKVSAAHAPALWLGLRG